MFLPGELLALARKFGLMPTETLDHACFERASQRLTEELLLPLLSRSLGSEDSGLRVEDFSRGPVPLGEFDFPRDALSPTGMRKARS